MICLPDVNVWIALTVAEHVHHKAATSWYKAVEWETLIFCRVTQMGFLRLLTNRSVMGIEARSVEGAWAVIDQLRRSPQIRFASEPPGIESRWRTLPSPAQTGSSFWTDAYLAAFAKATGYTLVTFDRGFDRYRNIPVKILQ
jgi:toxin-antitoxin system PIN domain toxin